MLADETILAQIAQSMAQYAARLRSGQQFAASAEAMDLLARHFPRHPWLPRLRGELAEARGDLAAAAAHFAADCSAAPADPGRLLRWGRCLGRLGRHDEALAALAPGLAATAHPLHEELLIEQVAQLRLAGRFDAAAAALDALAAHRPGHPQLHRLAGELADASGDLAAAERHFAADVAAEPDDACKRLRWARSLGRLQRHREALAILEDGLVQQPSQPELLVEQVTQLRETGRIEAAAAALERLAEHHPQHPRLAQLSGELAEAQGDLRAAARHFAEDFAAAPDDLGKRLRWARCLGRLSRHGPALAILAEGLARQPAHPDLLVEQVTQLRLTGQFAAAAGALALLARHRPDHARLRQLGGDLAEAQGDLEGAAALFAADVAAAPGALVKRLRWARCLGRLRRHEAALSALAEGLARQPGQPALLAEAVTQLCRAGRAEAAAAALADLAGHDPGHPQLARLQSEVAAARREGAAGFAGLPARRLRAAGRAQAALRRIQHFALPRLKVMRLRAPRPA